MAHFYQDGQTTVMTVEELRQLYPSIQLTENGGESVYITMAANTADGIDYQQNENQVLIDQSTGQVQLGYHQQVVQQCHQSQVLTVVQPEPTENGQPENMETQQIPMASHQITYQHQQQINHQIQQQQLHQLQQEQMQLQQVQQQQIQQHFQQEQQQRQQQQQQQQYFTSSQNDSNGYVTQEQVHMQLQPQQQVIPMQVDDQDNTSTFIQAGSQMLVRTGNMLALPDGRKIPLRDWRQPKVMAAAAAAAATTTAPVNHVPEGSTVITQLRPTPQPARTVINRAPQQIPSYSYRNTNLGVVRQQSPQQQTIPIRQLAPTTLRHFPAGVQTITTSSGVSYMVTSQSAQQPQPLPSVQRRQSYAPRRPAQKPPQRAKGRVRSAPGGDVQLTEEELQKQADATAQFILNQHRQSEANKRLQQQQQQKQHQQELQLQQRQAKQQQQHRQQQLQHRLPQHPSVIQQPQSMQHRSLLQHQLEQHRQPPPAILQPPPLVHMHNEQVLPMEEMVENHTTVMAGDDSIEETTASLMIVLPNGETMTVDNSQGLPIADILHQLGFSSDNYQVLNTYEPVCEQPAEQQLSQPPISEQPQQQQQNVTYQTLVDGVIEGEVLEEGEVLQEVEPTKVEPTNGQCQQNDSNFKVAEMCIVYTSPVNPSVMVETVITSSGKVTSLQKMQCPQPEGTKQTVSQQQIPAPVVEEPVVKKPPEVLPRYVTGFYALCSKCGYLSLDHNRCQRCSRLLPADPKKVPIDKIKPAPVLAPPVPPPIKEEPAVVDTAEPAASGGNLTPAKLVPTLSKPPAPFFVEMPLPRFKKIRPPAVRKVAKPKVVEEPVILTLSSDDEGSDTESTSVPMLFSTPSSIAENMMMIVSSAKKKEPPLMKLEDDTTEPMEAVNGDFPDVANLDQLKDGSTDLQYTLLSCRTVRIGSYKVVPKERVQISKYGIKMEVPALDDENKTVKIILRHKEIVKVLIHFGRTMPVLFVYAGPKAGLRISEQLKMNPKMGPYYDPSGLEIQRRITILPSRLTEESKVTLKNIFTAGDVLSELSHPEANEILVRASPTENGRAFECRLRKDKEKETIRKAPGKSKSLPRSRLARYKGVPHVRKKTRQIMVYPPHPETGGITINTEDYACLGGMQFLNDVIIDFYLKYLTLNVLSDADRKRTHIFSTFFYKRLTTRPKKKGANNKTFEEDPKLSPAEKRHARVKSWTKKVNVFDKDFIIIPINENAHWFLAIICFAGLTGPVSMADDSPVTAQSATRKRPVGRSRKTSQPDNEPKLPVGPPTIELDPPGSDRDEAEEEEEDLEQNSDDEEGNASQAADESGVDATQLADEQAAAKVKEAKVKPAAKNTLTPIKQPCILIFDSLAGGKRTRVVATLRDYLRIEYKAKMKKDRVFDKDTIKGATPKVPQQNNFFDCGLFVLQYVESFFQTPIKDYRIPISELKCWFDNEIVARKREDLSELLMRLMRENKIDVESLNLPVLSFAITESMDGLYDDGELADHLEERDQHGTMARLMKTETIYTPEINNSRFIDESEELGDTAETQEAMIENGAFSSVLTVEVPREQGPGVKLVMYPDSDENEEVENECGGNVQSFSNLKRIVPNQDILVSNAKRKKTTKLANSQ